MPSSTGSSSLLQAPRPVGGPRLMPWASLEGFSTADTNTHVELPRVARYQKQRAPSHPPREGHGHMTAFDPSGPEDDGTDRERYDGIDAQRFEQEFGESLSEVLDLGTWSSGPDFPALHERLDREVEEAVRQEDRVARQLPTPLRSWLAAPPRHNVPPLAGIHPVSPEILEKVHRTTLFTGDVEACDGTVLVHDSVALTIIQLGICLVSY